MQFKSSDMSRVV